MDSDLLQGFYLGDLLIDPRDGRVSGRSGSVHLPPKAMEVLLYLASSPGDLVTRESLIDSVWGEGHGSAEALNHAISEIRQALDDHHDHSKFIQTLPKRGYRLLIKPVPARAHTDSVMFGFKTGTAVDHIGLFENLKRRGVFETGIAYLVLGWLLIQVADIVFTQLLLPAWMATFVTALVIAGLPIAIALSWYLEFRDGRAIVHELSPKDAVRRRFGRTYLSVVGALAIAALIVSIYDISVGLPQAEVLDSNGQDSLPPIQDNSIAVLPFLNLDGSEETQIFANGLADDVITRLSRVPGLLVSSRGDAFTLNPNSASARVRERLRVARYVEGSAQINGEIVRVIVQLIDSETGFHVLSRRFDKPLDRYFEMRDEITELIVANVRVALPPATRATSELTVADPSIDVYMLYRRGVDASRKPDMADSIDTVLGWFDAALEIDPGYAAAHAGKCTVYVDAYSVAYDPAYIEDAQSSCAMALNLNLNLDVVYTALGKLYQATGRYDRSEDAYLEALEIDPGSTTSLIGLGEVYRLQQRPSEAEASIRQAAGLHPGDWAAFNALGNYLYRSGRHDEAAEQYRNAVALDDTNGRGHKNLGTTLMMAGEFEAAEPEYRRAIELDRNAAAYTNLGLLLYFLERFDEAIDAHREAVRLTPQDYLAHANLGDALRVAGNTEEAASVFRTAEELVSRALAVNTNDAFVLMDFAWISAVLGNYDRSRDLIERALALVPDEPYVHYFDGLILNLGGDTAGALAALELAVTNGYSTQMLAADPNLSGLRGDSRFEAVLALTY